MEQSNIGYEHLNFEGLHLNKRENVQIRKSVNKKLKEITAKTKTGFVEQNNIGYEHLNFEGLRLNKRENVQIKNL